VVLILFVEISILFLKGTSYLLVQKVDAKLSTKNPDLNLFNPDLNLEQKDDAGISFK
jgi:hypothetical protein